MKLLVLGGTGFLSRHVVDAALARDHDVTTLTRGLSGRPSDGVTVLTADRLDADAFAGATRGLPFDAVIDCSGRAVAGARIAAQHLGDVARYAYVSSINAYRNWPPGPVTGEHEPLWTDTDTLDAYGPMKAESERVLGDALGERLLVVRAGLLIGRYDDTERMTSWLARIANESETIVPDTHAQPMSLLDARDLASWIVLAVERGTSGPVNAAGPIGMTTLGGLLDACRSLVGASGSAPADFVPIPEQRLLDAGVEPWRHLPFWLPHDVAQTAWQVNTDRAQSLGLASRPLEDTLADTWAWMRETGLSFAPPEHGGPGLPADIRSALLT